MATITKKGKDVLYSNPEFAEDTKLKNSFKAAVKDAGYDMHWDKDEKAFRITDAKTKDITKIDKSHMNAKVEEKASQKPVYPVNQQGKNVTYSNPKFAEDEKLKNSFKAAVKDAGYDMHWDKQQKLFIIENSDKKDIIGIHKNHMNTKVDAKTSQKSTAEITQDKKDVLYSNSAFIEDTKLKNSFKAAVKDAGYNMHWDKDKKAFRIENAKLSDITKLDMKSGNVEVKEKASQKSTSVKEKNKISVEVDPDEWAKFADFANKVAQKAQTKQNNPKMG